MQKSWRIFEGGTWDETVGTRGLFLFGCDVFHDWGGRGLVKI
jgi:hypothetical protein